MHVQLFVKYWEGMRIGMKIKNELKLKPSRGPVPFLEVEVLHSKVPGAAVHGQQCIRRRTVDLQLLVQLEEHGARLERCRPIKQHPDEGFLLECRAFTRRSKENLLVYLLDRFEKGARMEVLALGEYARWLRPGGRWLVLGHLLGSISAKAPPVIVPRVLWSGVHDCLAA